MSEPQSRTIMSRASSVRTARHAAAAALVTMMVAGSVAASGAAGPTAPYLAPVPPIRTVAIPPSAPVPPQPPVVPAHPMAPPPPPAPPAPPARLDKLGVEDRVAIRAALRAAAEARRAAMAAAADAREQAFAERASVLRDIPARIEARMAAARSRMAAVCAAKGFTPPADADFGTLATCGHDYRSHVRAALDSARASVGAARGLSDEERKAALSGIDKALADTERDARPAPALQ